MKKTDNEFLSKDLYENIHKYLDFGFNENTIFKLNNNFHVTINNIEPGNILKGNIVVYGVVEINGQDLCNTNKYNLGDNKIGNISLENNSNKLYHILTCPTTFNINSGTFKDYNSNIYEILI